MTTAPPRSFRLLSSTKIALGFVALVALYLGWGYMRSSRVRGMDFRPLEPGKVNLVAVSGLDFRIQVQNGVAKLVKGQSEFKDNTGSEQDETNKKIISLREMLEAMQGRQEGLDRFVMAMNGFKEDDLPSVRVVWKQEDIDRALGGDPALKPKLIHDLGVNFDGSPLNQFSRSAVFNGIVVDFPVQVSVPTANGIEVKTARYLAPYRPRMCRTVEELCSAKAVVTPQMILGYYLQVSDAQKQDPTKQEDVATSLRSIYSDGRKRQLRDLPEQVLKHVQVVVNENLIDKVRYEPYDTNNGRRFKMILDLSDEGRDRLWKFSAQGNVGKQLLLVENGIAIAAPKIQTELSDTQLTINELPDEGLVQDTIREIESKGKEEKSS